MLMVTGDGWEPDALTAQVRFWEGSNFQLRMDRLIGHLARETARKRRKSTLC
ncbi:hypothetical protein Poly21_56960 [Allorhodopirellula heiligendammensis]|uniref:Uncharacterized protein n=1 Tax=Allorhodopirellula heiligendammensis TaxID=2714739 RepID=A0A5C6B1P2_9BACT|nr:hypothetical protein Poly21_56960 [Allorhodopirellula heiligendammensis]